MGCEVIVTARICRPDHFNAPVLSDKGHVGCNWRDNFQFAQHFQDAMRLVRPPACSCEQMGAPYMMFGYDVCY